MKDKFLIREISGAHEMEDVRKISCRNYMEKKYISCNRDGDCLGCPGVIQFEGKCDFVKDTNVVFGAFAVSGEIVGTISCALSTNEFVPTVKTFPGVFEEETSYYAIGWRYDVKAAYRSAFLGKRLLCAIVKWSIDRGAKALFGEIHPDHVPVYLTLGFVEKERVEKSDLVNAPGVLVRLSLHTEKPSPLVRDALRMRKER